MAESAAQIQYRQQLVAEFEEGMSWLRRTTTTEAMVKGNQATFAVSGSGGATATTRGINGLISARGNSLSQVTATLSEWHDLVRTSDFNVFQSQGDLKKEMQKSTRKVLNRRVDADIIAQLDTASTNLGAATTMSLAVVAQALTTLGENEVPTEEEDAMWAVMTPAVRGYLMQIPEWISSDYVEVKPLTGPAVRVKRCWGFNWIFHPKLTGVGTGSEKCYFYHRDAMGSAFDSENLRTAYGYDDEQDYWYARASSYTGAAVLQQSGILQFLHDATQI